MASAAVGFVALPAALCLDMISVALYRAIWAAFLIAGNYFCNWFGHEGSQNTHFQMLNWGIANSVGLIRQAIYFA